MIRILLAGFAVWLGAALALAAPLRAQITFPGAAPVSAGEIAVRLMPSLDEGTQGVQGINGRTVVQYGATPMLMLQAQALPVSDSANVATAGGTQQLSATGLGDTLLGARYTVFYLDEIGSTFRIAPLVNVIVPTGMDNANSQAPRYLQPGAGAWGSRDALTMTWLTLHWVAAAEVGYQVNAPGAGYQFGDTFFADAGFHYRVWPAGFGPNEASELHVYVETNYTMTGVNRAQEQVVPGSGRTLWLIDPGIMYLTPRYSIALNALLPIDQQEPPGASRFLYGALLAFRWSFFTPHHW
jgi:hypothetical protein